MMLKYSISFHSEWMMDKQLILAMQEKKIDWQKLLLNDTISITIHLACFSWEDDKQVLKHTSQTERVIVV